MRKGAPGKVLEQVQNSSAARVLGARDPGGLCSWSEQGPEGVRIRKGLEKGSQGSLL